MRFHLVIAFSEFEHFAAVGHDDVALPKRANCRLVRVDLEAGAIFFRAAHTGFTLSSMGGSDAIAVANVFFWGPTEMAFFSRCLGCRGAIMGGQAFLESYLGKKWVFALE